MLHKDNKNWLEVQNKINLGHFVKHRGKFGYK